MRKKKERKQALVGLKPFVHNFVSFLIVVFSCYWLDLIGVFKTKNTLYVV